MIYIEIALILFAIVMGIPAWIDFFRNRKLSDGVSTADREEVLNKLDLLREDIEKGALIKLMTAAGVLRIPTKLSEESIEILRKITRPEGRVAAISVEIIQTPQNFSLLTRKELYLIYEIVLAVLEKHNLDK